MEVKAQVLPKYPDAKFVVLSDWDGTITQQDSNDLTDNYGFGPVERRRINLEILAERTSFRDGFLEMLASLSRDGKQIPFETCKQILKDNIQLDPGFPEFHKWCLENNVPFIIVSGGMEPLIQALLTKFVGEEAASTTDVISNNVTFAEDGTWRIKFRHPESPFGHDKSEAILPYTKNQACTFFFGDGVSDLSAAQHASVLFVKLKPNGESDLATYCEQKGIPHIIFSDFSQTVPIVQAVVKGTMTVAQAREIRDARPVILV